MRRTNVLCQILLVSLVALLIPSRADVVSAGVNVWTSHGPEGGQIRALAIDPVTPATLYAAARDNGVFKTANGGESWSQTGLTHIDVQAMAIHSATPSTLYAGTYGGGVFKSINGGASWSVFNSGLTSTAIRALAIDPATPATLYAGTWGGVFKSTKAGGYWVAANTGLTDTDIQALAIDPVTPTTLYARTEHAGVFKSTNGGANWSQTNTGVTTSDVQALAIDPGTPTTLYAGTHGGGVFDIQQVHSTYLPLVLKAARTPPEPVKIAIIGALSGPNAILGDCMKKGVTLAIEEKNGAGGICGRQIEIVIYDDEADPTNDLNDRTRAFAARYAARWNGEQAEMHRANTYDGTQMLMMAMEAACPNITGETIAAEFHRICGYKGLQGEFCVTPEGETITEAMLGVIIDGKLTAYTGN